MITRDINPKTINASYPFPDEDTSKIWKCRIVDSNLGTDGDPIVNFVSNGMIDMTFQRRHLNANLTVIFYESHEKAESEKVETVMTIAKDTPDLILQIWAKTAWVSKKLAFGILGLFALSTIFAAVNYHYDITGFLDKYQQYNAANGARVLTKKVDEIKKSFSEDIWEAPGIKRIEKETGLDFEDLYKRVGDNLFVMEDIIADKNDTPTIMDHEDAEDACERLGSTLLTNAQLTKVLPKFGFHRWADIPEWTSDSIGWMSDDYVIHQKEGKVPENGYIKGGNLVGDADDVKAAVRCAFTRDTFME